MAQTIEDMVADAIGDFSEWITRVDVHLSDENAGKGGHDKRIDRQRRPGSAKITDLDSTDSPE